MKIYTDSDGNYVLDLVTEIHSLHDPKRRASVEKSNIDESQLGQSNFESEILYKIETEGHALSDVYWMQHKNEIHELVRQGLVEQLETSNGSAGGTTRTLLLTPKGRLKMLVGRKETSGSIGKHLPGQHDQKTHAGSMVRNFATYENDAAVYEQALGRFPSWAKNEISKYRKRVFSRKKGFVTGIAGTFSVVSRPLEEQDSHPPVLNYTDERSAIHELAHNLDAAMGASKGSLSFSRSKLWKNVINSEKKNARQIHSAHLSKTNLSEDFATSVELFYTLPDYFSERYPKRAEFLTNFLSDKTPDDWEGYSDEPTPPASAFFIKEKSNL